MKPPRHVPPSQADFLVLRTLAAVLEHYITEPDSIKIETDDDANRAYAPAFVAAARRLHAEIELRAENLFEAEEQYVAALEREN